MIKTLIVSGPTHFSFDLGNLLQFSPKLNSSKLEYILENQYYKELLTHSLFYRVNNPSREKGFMESLDRTFIIVFGYGKNGFNREDGH